MNFQGSLYNISGLEIVNNQGIRLSLMGVFLTLQINEDLFSPFMYGSLLVKDAIGLQEIVKAYGDEVLAIRFTDATGSSVTKTFAIYSISAQANVENENTKMFGIKFISMEAYVNSTKKLRQTYRGNANDILFRIWREFSDSNKALYFLDFDADMLQKAAEKEFVFAATSWNPVQTINWLVSRLEHENQCDYMFYEAMDGYHVDSISYLSKKPVVFAYDFMSHNVTKPPALELINIIEHTQENTHDSLKNIHRGMFASKIFYIDTTKKQWKIHNFSYAESFNKSEHLEPSKYTNKPMDLKFTTKYDSHVSVLSNSSGLFIKNVLGEPAGNLNGDFANFAEQETGDVADYYQYRISQFKQLLFGPKAIFTAHGVMTYHVGNVIEINKKSSGLSVDNTADDQLSGKYLISNITHKFTPTEYYVELEARKNCYKKPLPGGSAEVQGGNAADRIDANGGGQPGYPLPNEGLPITMKEFEK